MAWLDKTL